MTDMVSGDISLLTFLVVIASCMSSLAIILIAFHMLGQRKAQAILENRLQHMEKQVQLQITSALGVGQRLIELEKRLQKLQDMQKDMRQGDLELSFIQAQKMIEQGMDADTVAASSGLSASEVSLMQMMRYQNSRESA